MRNPTNLPFSSDNVGSQAGGNGKENISTEENLSPVRRQLLSLCCTVKKMMTAISNAQLYAHVQLFIKAMPPRSTLGGQRRAQKGPSKRHCPHGKIELMGQSESCEIPGTTMLRDEFGSFLP